jgi:hypothetical protein
MAKDEMQRGKREAMEGDRRRAVRSPGREALGHDATKGRCDHQIRSLRWDTVEH